MSIRRSLSVRILNAVIRFAPLGAEEWPQAVLGEMGVIENDWTALSWAVGSTRILFSRPGTQLSDAGSALWAVEGLARKIRRRTVFGYTLASAMTLLFVSLIYTASSSMQRIGCYVGIAAMCYTWSQLFSLRVRRPWLESASGMAAAYRAELRRQRHFYCGVWLWSRLIVVIVSFVLFCIGGAAAHPESVPVYAAFAAWLLTMLAVAVWLNTRETRKYQCQIEQLDRFPQYVDHSE
jgi:hypothetical protein